VQYVYRIMLVYMAILIFEVEPSKYLKFYRSVTKKKLAILRTDY